MLFDSQKPFDSNSSSDKNRPGSDSFAINTSVPFTFSLLISNSLHPDIYSPVGTLIIPLYRPLVPYGYYILIGIELLTAMLFKWSSAHSGSYRYSLSNSTAFPDLTAINQYINTASPRQILGGEDLSVGQFSPQAGRALEQEIFQTPLIPSEGLTINLALAAPVRAIRSMASTAFTFKLKAIDNAPGYLIPFILVILYFLTGPYFKAKAERGDE
ncbi:hypothetical protein LPY66_03215 [Dehalobacter sp. DCM]|uniref:hypothetical protein n=1 Tax=Dehalobacter sp. DCM TaxID=2907827 RepID=UPI003081866C|nr:hypothetical protein LPY66_03215 [Dehalobacter sp. DCM]